MSQDVYQGDDIVAALQDTPYSERASISVNSMCPGSLAPVSKKSSRLCQTIEGRSAKELAQAIEARCMDERDLLEFLRAVCQGLNVLGDERKKCEVIRKCVSVISLGKVGPSAAQNCLQLLVADMPMMNLGVKRAEKLLSRTVDASVVTTSHGLPALLFPAFLHSLQQHHQRTRKLAAAAGLGEEENGDGNDDGRASASGAPFSSAGPPPSQAASPASEVTGEQLARQLLGMDWPASCATNLLVAVRELQVTSHELVTALVQKALHEVGPRAPAHQLSGMIHQVLLLAGASPTASQCRLTVVLGLCTLFERMANRDEDDEVMEDDKGDDDDGGGGLPPVLSSDSLSLLVGSTALQINFHAQQDRHLLATLNKLRAQLLWRPFGVACLLSCQQKALSTAVKSGVLAQCKLAARVDQLTGVVTEFSSMARAARGVLGRNTTPWARQLLSVESACVGQISAGQLFDIESKDGGGLTATAPPPAADSFLEQMRVICENRAGRGAVSALSQCIWQAANRGWDHLIPALVAMGISLLEAGALAHDRSTMRGGQTSNQSHHLADRAVSALALYVLACLFVQHSEVRDEIVSLLVARSVTSNRAVSSHSVRILTALVRLRPRLFSGRRLAHLQEVCASVCSLPPRVAGQLLAACLPLLSEQPRLADTVVLTLRKGAWDRALPVRWNAIQGVALLLHWLEARPANPIEGDAGGESRRGLSLIQSEDLIHLMARCLDQQMALRLCFYQTCSSACGATERLTTLDLLAQLLDKQLQQYMCAQYEDDESFIGGGASGRGAAPASILLLNRCFDDRRLEPAGSPYEKLPLLLEPLPDLIECSVQCVAAARRLAVSGSGSGSTSASAAVDRLASKLDWLVEHAAEDGASEWWGLRNATWGAVTREGQQTRRSATLALGVLERLCEHALNGSSLRSSSSSPSAPSASVRRRPLGLSIRLVERLLEKWARLAGHLQERGGAVDLADDQPLSDWYAWDNNLLAMAHAVTENRVPDSGGVGDSRSTSRLRSVATAALSSGGRGPVPPPGDGDEDDVAAAAAAAAAAVSAAVDANRPFNKDRQSTMPFARQLSLRVIVRLFRLMRPTAESSDASSPVSAGGVAAGFQSSSEESAEVCEYLKASRVIRYHLWRSAALRVRSAVRPAATSLRGESSWLWPYRRADDWPRRLAYELASYSLSEFYELANIDTDAATDDDDRTMSTLGLNVASQCFNLLIAHAAPDQALDVPHILALLYRSQRQYAAAAAAAAASVSLSAPETPPLTVGDVVSPAYRARPLNVNPKVRLQTEFDRVAAVNRTDDDDDAAAAAAAAPVKTASIAPQSSLREAPEQSLEPTEANEVVHSPSDTPAAAVSTTSTTTRTVLEHFERKSEPERAVSLSRRIQKMLRIVSQLLQMILRSDESPAMLHMYSVQAEQFCAVIDCVLFESWAARSCLRPPDFEQVFQWGCDRLKQQVSDPSRWKACLPVFRSVVQWTFRLHYVRRDVKMPAKFSRDVRDLFGGEQEPNTFRALARVTAPASYQVLVGWIEQSLALHEQQIELARHWHRALLPVHHLQPALALEQTTQARQAILMAADCAIRPREHSQAETAVERALDHAYGRFRPVIASLHNLLHADLPVASRDRLLRVLSRFFKVVLSAMRERFEAKAAPPQAIVKNLSSTGTYLIPTVYKWLNTVSNQHHDAAMAKHKNDGDGDDEEEEKGERSDNLSSSGDEDDLDDDDDNDDDVKHAKKKRKSSKKGASSVLRRSMSRLCDDEDEDTDGSKKRKKSSVPTTAKVMKEARAVPVLIEQMEKVQLFARKWGAQYSVDLSAMFSGHQARGFEVDLGALQTRLAEQRKEEEDFDDEHLEEEKEEEEEEDSN